METVSESPVIPVSALEANHVLSALPVTVAETTSEFTRGHSWTVCPFPAKVADPEPSVCPVMTKKVVSELCDCPVLSWPGRPVPKSLFALSWPRRSFLNPLTVHPWPRRPSVNPQSCLWTWNLWTVVHELPVLPVIVLCHGQRPPLNSLNVLSRQKRLSVNSLPVLSRLWRRLWTLCFLVIAAEPVVNLSGLFVPVLPVPPWLTVQLWGPLALLWWSSTPPWHPAPPWFTAPTWLPAPLALTQSPVPPLPHGPGPPSCPLLHLPPGLWSVKERLEAITGHSSLTFLPFTQDSISHNPLPGLISTHQLQSPVSSPYLSHTIRMAHTLTPLMIVSL